MVGPASLSALQIIDGLLALIAVCVDDADGRGAFRFEGDDYLMLLACEIGNSGGQRARGAGIAECYNIAVPDFIVCAGKYGIPDFLSVTVVVCAAQDNHLTFVGITNDLITNAPYREEFLQGSGHVVFRIHQRFFTHHFEDLEGIAFAKGAITCS